MPANTRNKLSRVNTVTDNDLLLNQLIPSDDFFHNSDEETEGLSILNNDILPPIQQINKDLGNNKNWLRVAHINARSISHHITELRRLITDTDLDIIGVSETFIKENTPADRFTIDNYQLFKENRVHTTQGGVGIYIKRNIPIKQLQVPHDIKHPELICVVATINNIKVAIITVYKTPKLSYKTFDLIVEFIAHISCSYTHTIILGDFNIDQLNKNTTEYK